MMIVINNMGTKKNYKRKSHLLTKSEANFYKQLKRNVKSGVDVHFKVRLADVVEPIGKNKSFLYKVQAKHLDFVVVDVETSKILFAIELDDKSHNSFGARKRDNEKNNAMKEAGVKLIRIKATKVYSSSTFAMLNGEINEVLGKKVIVDIGNCPRCGKNSIEKITMKFPNKGKVFYRCVECNFRTDPE